MTPAIWLAHTRADRYPEPFAFRPERFLDGAPATSAWVPFGGGVRRCIGAAFAEMEMRVALAEILRRRTLRAASGERRARRSPQRHVLAGGRHAGDRRRAPRRVTTARQGRAKATPSSTRESRRVPVQELPVFPTGTIVNTITSDRLRKAETARLARRDTDEQPRPRRRSRRIRALASVRFAALR